MSATISLGRRVATRVRISETALAIAIAAVATVLTIICAATGSDLLMYVSATVGLAAVYTLDRKGGER